MIHLATAELDRGPVVAYCSFPIVGLRWDRLWHAFRRGRETPRPRGSGGRRRRGASRCSPRSAARVSAARSRCSTRRCASSPRGSLWCATARGRRDRAAAPRPHRRRRSRAAPTPRERRRPAPPRAEAIDTGGAYDRDAAPVRDRLRGSAHPQRQRHGGLRRLRARRAPSCSPASRATTTSSPTCVHKPGYNAGDTLRLIVPFLLAYGVGDRDVEEYSADTVLVVPGARDLLRDVARGAARRTSSRPRIRPTCGRSAGSPAFRSRSAAARSSSSTPGT